MRPAQLNSLTLQVSLRAPSACLFCLLRAPIAFARLLLHLHHNIASAPLYQDCYCSANHIHRVLGPVTHHLGLQHCVRDLSMKTAVSARYVL